MQNMHSSFRCHSVYLQSILAYLCTELVYIAKDDWWGFHWWSGSRIKITDQDPSSGFENGFEIRITTKDTIFLDICQYEENRGYKRKYEIGLSGDFIVHSVRVCKAHRVHTHAKMTTRTRATYIKRKLVFKVWTPSTSNLYCRFLNHPPL